MDGPVPGPVSGGVVYTYAYGRADANGVPVIVTRTITRSDDDGTTGVVSDLFGYRLGLADASDSGATKFGAWWETTTTGAWLQRDTLDAPLDPGNANRYAFVGCDPINGSDASGMLSEAQCSGVGRLMAVEEDIVAGLVVAALFPTPAAPFLGAAVAGIGVGLAFGTTIRAFWC